jgi:putative membrane protein
MRTKRPFFFLYVLVGNAATAPTAFAHSVGSDPLAWNPNPWILAGLLVAVSLYAGGLRRLWRNARRGAGVPVWKAACFAAGCAVLAVAMLSPIDALGAELFSIHMAQHELLMLVAAPLIVSGRPLAVFLWAFPPNWRKRIARIIKAGVIQRSWLALTRPFAAWLLHAIVLWAWHFPALFQASLADDVVHAVQHFSFLASALLFWSFSIAPNSQLQMRYGAAVMYLLTTAIHTGILGALLTFSPRTWYPAYSATTEAWGLTALQDQQLGGLIMWVPAGFVFVFAGLAVAAKAINAQCTKLHAQ